jgi:hypothetical protein
MRRTRETFAAAGDECLATPGKFNAFLDGCGSSTDAYGSTYNATRRPSEICMGS